MQDVLRTYLNDAATHEMRDAIVAAHDSLKNMSLPNYEEGFEELLMLDEPTDAGGTLESIVDLTKSLQHEILKQHEIVLNEDASLDMLTLFVNGVLDITNYEDKNTIYDTTIMGGLPEEIYAELMAIVTDKDVEDLMINISSVSIALINRIRSMSTSTLIEEENNDDDIIEKQKHIDIFNRFIGLAGTKELEIVKLVTEAGISIGYPFSVYVGIIGRNLEAMSTTKAARELLGMALLSFDGIDRPRTVIKDHIDNYISNIDNITKIDVEIGNLLLGLQL